MRNPATTTVTYGAHDPYGGYAFRTLQFTGTANETRRVVENSPAGTAVGRHLGGTRYDDGDDQTDDALTHTMTGDVADSGLFVLDSATGQLSVAEGASLDHEAKSSYTGKVHFTVQGRAALINLTVQVTDVTGPGIPAAPDVEAGATMPATTLDVDWTAPDDLGSPITGYRVQYRAAGPNEWIAHASSGTGTETTITGLTPASVYEVQVLAVNAEGESDWSDTGTGVTGPRRVSVQRSLPENAQPGTLVGDPVAVTAPEGITLSYSVVPTVTEANGNRARSTSETDGSDKFVVDPASGQIRLARGASLDYETARNHSLTMRATHTVAGYDGRILNTVISVVIDVTDVDESSPTPPPAVTPAPALTLESGSRAVAENSPGGTHVGAAVAAQGGDGEPLTYAISGDAAFSIDAATGQISVAEGALLDHESTPSYTVSVSVSDGKDANGDADPSVDASADFTIRVTDVDEPPPTPDAPWVTQSPVDPDTELDVSWVAALLSGVPETTDYDVRYRVEGASDWTSHPFDGVVPSTTLTGLQPGTTYEVQVLARNHEGASAWSASGAGATAASGPVRLNAQRAVPENTPPGTPVGAPLTTTDSQGHTIVYSIVGDEIESAGRQFRRAASRRSAGTTVHQRTLGHAEFTVDPATGQIRVAPGASLDFETSHRHSLTVQARHAAPGRNDGHIVNAIIHVVIDILDVDETPPASLTLEPASREVAENSAGSTLVGAPIAAQGSDGDDTLAYAISGSDLFTIDAATGQIRVAAGAGLDHEAAPSHAVTVSVSDGKDADGNADSSADASAAVTI
ncbi:MAG: cadherin domain-containing protein, partial [Chloroflexota bacterium]|nr:cadherin domain-containing protein [Chloroflexota bacterium]